MANGEQILGRILTGGAAGAIEGLEARERAEDRALLRDFQGRQLDIQERSILLREQQAQAEIDRSNKINELSQGIVDSQNLIDRSRQFNEVVKTLGDKDLFETSPEEQRQLVQMISALRRGGSGIAITSEGIMVPFEEDEEGNPVFIDIATMRQAVENARNTIAANRVKLETLDPSIDLNNILQTQTREINPIIRSGKIGDFAVNIRQDGSIDVPSEDFQRRLVAESRANPVRKMTIQERDPATGVTEDRDILVETFTDADGRTKAREIPVIPSVRAEIDEAGTQEEKTNILDRFTQTLNNVLREFRETGIENPGQFAPGRNPRVREDIDRAIEEVR